MPRTNIAKSRVLQRTPLKAKLDDYDTSIDALEALTLGAGDFKQSVRAALTTNLTLSGEQTIDGVAVVAGDRVLAAGQTTSADKGIYVAALAGWTRATDMDASSEATSGVQVYVSEGTANGNHVFILTTDDPIVLGTDGQTWAKVPNAVDLAATSSGLGASLIGIQDAGALITATTVEAALAEIAAANWVTAARITDAILTGAKAAVVADNAVIGGIPVVHVVAVPDGVTGDVDVVLTHKTEITSIEVIKAGGAGGASDTLQVKNTADAITNAMDINVADKVIVRPSTIDDAFTTIAAAGTLRITRTKASAANVACRVVVWGVRRT